MFWTCRGREQVRKRGKEMAIDKVDPIGKHYDVGVLGVWFGANYGSLLNGYAVYKLLNKMGKKVLMIHKIGAMPNDGEINGTHNARFIEKFYPDEDISPVYSYEHLSELNKYCDAFLTGSDQIWHYNINSYFHMSFFMNFVDKDKRKISFGTSFGHAQDFTPVELRGDYRKLLQKFHAISVREESAVDLCKNVYGVNAQTVIEPVFCIDKEEYDRLAEASAIALDEHYILAYILDPTDKKREVLQYYSERSGKKLIIIPDGQPSTYRKNKEALNLPNCLAGIGAEDFVKLFQNADFVISDSFHGTAFSIIFNKPFLSIANQKRGYARFEDLLGRFDLMNRMVYDRDLDTYGRNEGFLKEFDYSETNQKIQSARQDALAWLEKALNTPTAQLPSVCIEDFKIPEQEKRIMAEQHTVLKIVTENKCVGCSACVSACPTGALTLEADNLGYYRAVLHLEKCINCGKCQKVCPAYRLPEKRNAKNPKCYEFITSDQKLLEKSSSGGIFGLLARLVLNKGGIVCGAAWKDDFSVEHVFIDSTEELSKLQKSKYMQSYMGDIPKQIKRLLDSGREVLFSGCPCQVAGLLSFLEKDYSNLVTIDLLCGSAPSAMFFQKYIEEEFPDGIKKYEFRHKVQGWTTDCLTVAVTVTDGRTEVRRGGAQDNYQRVYHNHVMCAQHCEKCQFQSSPRYGDITIGDFWWLNSKDAEVNVKDGVSAVLINNSKGERLFAEIPDEMIAVKKEAPIEWLSGNGFVKGNKNWASPSRDSFYAAIQKMGFKEASDHALKPNYDLRPRDGKHVVLDHSSKLYHFRYDPSVWQEVELFGYQTLMVKPGESKVGRYACLPLYESLSKGKEYRLYFRFKINSESSILNLHIKDSGTKYYQLIHSHKISHADIWEVADIEFTPQSDIFDEFMVGASQVKGMENYLCIDCIRITEA